MTTIERVLAAMAMVGGISTALLLIDDRFEKSEDHHFDLQDVQQKLYVQSDTLIEFRLDDTAEKIARLEAKRKNFGLIPEEEDQLINAKAMHKTLIDEQKRRLK